MAGHRVDRISEELKKAVSTILSDELKDPAIPPMTSVVSAQVTNDLRHAKIMVSVMGDEKTQQEAIQALRRSEGFVRRQVGRYITLRYTPEIHFHLDHSITYSIEVGRLLDQIRNDDDETPSR